MTTAGIAVLYKLTHDSNLSALGGRIYPVAQDEGVNTYPVVTYENGDPELDRTYSGASGLVKREITLYVKDPSSSNAESMAALIRTSIDNQKGTWGTVQVVGAFFKGQSITRDTNEVGDETAFFVIEQTYQIWTQE